MDFVRSNFLQNPYLSRFLQFWGFTILLVIGTHCFKFPTQSLNSSRSFSDYLYGPLKILGCRVLSCKKSTYLVATVHEAVIIKQLFSIPASNILKKIRLFFVEENIFYISCKKNMRWPGSWETFYQCNITWVLKFSYWV